MFRPSRVTLFTSLFLSLLVLAACSQQPKDRVVLPEGIHFVEAVSATVDNNGDPVLPYQKYQLENGLTLLLHQDHSDPITHVDVTYHVGSAREQLGKSGFAHFFEHMMFQGSKHVADEQHFRIISEAGGTLNGTTNSDRTNYYQTVPANQLEKVLWLESDRMGFLLEAVTQEKFEVQRATVKNERAQRYDNAPYGLLYERVSQALYPENHPYSWPTIGYVEDLDRVNVNDLKAFFLRWYGPNNATLTIGGDIDVEQTLAWVAKYFGPIAAGPDVDGDAKTLVTLPDTRYISMEDRVHLPLLYISFPTVYGRHEDEAALDLLADVLGGGKQSLFYQHLVKAGYAVQAGVSHPCQELACSFNLYALANPEKMPSLADMEKALRAAIDDFEQRGVTQDDLDKVQAQFEASTIFGLQSVSGKVSTLAFNETFADSPDQIADDLARYRAVTKADVERVYRTYIKDKPAVVMSIVPQGQLALIAAPDNFKPAARQIPQAEEMTAAQLALRPVTETFDRNKVPEAGPSPVVHVPDAWRATLDNGIPVIGSEIDETPTVTLLLSIEGGPLLDPEGKAGTASLTAAMLNEATQQRSGEAMALALDKLGSRISARASGRYTEIAVSSLARHLDETLLLLQEILLQPKFDAADFERLKAQTLQSLVQSAKDPGALASRAQLQVLYGEQRIGLPDGGIFSSVQGISLQDVQQFYQQNYSAKAAQLVVVGSLSKAQWLPKLDWLGQWAGESLSFADYQDFPQYEKSTIYVVDLPEAAQSAIRVVRRAMPYDATGDYFKAGLMNFPLGGAFNSRINMNLREEKGYTYGARSGFSGGKTLGRFSVSTSVREDVTGLALTEILNELAIYSEQGIDAGELAFLRQAVSQSEALSYETPSQKAGFLRQMLNYQLDPSFAQTQGEIVATIDKPALNALAAKWLQPDTMQIVIVGDAAKVLPQLLSLGLPIETVTMQP
ncbi:M16 family metallopeptidase [Corallincola spongiicola]|uniref:Insulinase family protein n=1 Tax=Corallincola spongiicola TaxID=2520508 RepID=A0ABY1WRM2_9GAMM|nr:pitrilysin family protein [Corallincola spongiicola]TAA47381.1 insulinase family protein [Corallincola spongiicola]